MIDTTGEPPGLVATRVTVTGLELLSPLRLGVGEIEVTATVGGEVSWETVAVLLALLTAVQL